MESSGGSELKNLVRQCLTGDQRAMLALVERFQGQVYGLCFRMLGQRQDAEDAAQETFVRVLKNLHRWDPDRAFQPWLLTIAGNRCRTALAARRRRPATELKEELIADPEPDHEAGRQLAEEMHLALAYLRPDYRQAFLLFHEHELSYGEIAETLAVPLGTIKTWVHRARRELIDKLRQRGAIEADGLDSNRGEMGAGRHELRSV
jgi:RNA polymerase sigma-70 factor (ECF subfamily)